MSRRRALSGGNEDNSTRHKMPDAPAYDPQYWRDRADRARAKASQVTDPRSERMLQGIAEAYERLADRVKQRLREPGKSN
jgi:hypothetical protein